MKQEHQNSLFGFKIQGTLWYDVLNLIVTTRIWNFLVRSVRIKALT